MSCQKQPSVRMIGCRNSPLLSVSQPPLRALLHLFDMGNDRGDDKPSIPYSYHGDMQADVIFAPDKSTVGEIIVQNSENEQVSSE